MPDVTIVIRARNEEFWIRRLLAQLQIQNFRDYEVVLVDNKSTDKTREIFRKCMPDGKILEIDDFKPGKAINQGIQAGSAKLVVILSAHCVPVHENWLDSFVDIMKDPNIAAAYGRQVPLPTSHPLDKRDLLNTFGIERRIQKKDTFFHNANSIIRRDIWERFPFDEETLHIEDRIWADQIIKNDMYIAYEPEASVYHYHGINHHHDMGRAHVISDILTKHTFENGGTLPAFLLPHTSATLYCFLGHDHHTDSKFKVLFKEIQEQCPVGKFFVHSRACHVLANQKESYHILPYHWEEDQKLTFVSILRKMLHESHRMSFFPDGLVYINLNLMGLKAQYINDSINFFYRGMYDSVFFAQQEFSNIWRKNGSGYQQIFPDYSPKGKKDPIFLARYGLGLVTKPAFIESESLVGSHVAILNLHEIKTE